jgi:hypothetical protein
VSYSYYIFDVKRSTLTRGVCDRTVIYGIESFRHANAETLSALTKSYGISISQKSNGVWRFHWLMQKGDLVLEHEKRVALSDGLWLGPAQYQPTGRYDLRIFSYSSRDDDDAPEDWEDGQEGTFPNRISDVAWLLLILK